ncbi:MAG: LysR substrate-binding domain-containing protein [Betaproteobacteria bacterium]
MDRFNLMHAFVRIAETSSISAVARELGATQPTVSKQLAALEAQLGVTLLRRTTRRLSLTEAGAAYYESARQILEQVAEAEAGVSRLSAAPSGTLKLAGPHALGQAFLDTLVIEFQRIHPQLKVQLIESERYTDLIEEGIDVAVRVGQLVDSTLIVRRLGASRRVIVGAPEYLERHGEPTAPQDLARHNCILYSYLASGDVWDFKGPKGMIPVRVNGNFRSSSGNAIREAVVRGLGLAAAPIWLVHHQLGCGRLRTVLSDFAPPATAISAVYPSARHVTAKVRIFVDYLKGEFANIPELN